MGLVKPLEPMPTENQVVNVLFLIENFIYPFKDLKSIFWIALNIQATVIVDCLKAKGVQRF